MRLLGAVAVICLLGPAGGAEAQVAGQTPLTLGAFPNIDRSLPYIATSQPKSAADVPGVSLAYPEPGAVAQNAASEGWRVWGAGTGAWSRTGAHGQPGAAIESRAGGFALAVEKVVDPTLLIGFAAGYVHSETRSTGVRSTSDTGTGSAYLSWNPYAGFEVDGLLGLSATGTDTRRTLVFGGVPVQLSGSTGGPGMTALGSVGYRQRFDTDAGKAFIKPFASLSYSAQDRRDYTEYGPGVTLTFPSKLFERATANVGIAGGIEMALANGLTLRPELGVAWSRFLANPSPAVLAYLNGSPIPLVLRDPRPGQDGAIVSAQLSAYRSGNFQVFAGYSGEFRENYTAHLVQTGFRISW
ncbi:MAG TPA: autotransporter outer membrane beta-barrel domain-containing protein [Enterovirga sp.]